MFAAYAAVVNLTVLMIARETDATLAHLARALRGSPSQALHCGAELVRIHAAENHWRGKAVAAFYMTYVLGIGLGSIFVHRLAGRGGGADAGCLLHHHGHSRPVALTRLETPPPPASISIALRSVWKISPVGLMGMVAVGGLTLLVQGFTPIFAAAENQAASRT